MRGAPTAGSTFHYDRQMNTDVYFFTAEDAKNAEFFISDRISGIFWILFIPRKKDMVSLANTVRVWEHHAETVGITFTQPFQALVFQFLSEPSLIQSL